MRGGEMGYRGCSTGYRGSSTRLAPAGNRVVAGRLPELAGFQYPYRRGRIRSREPATNTSRGRNRFTAGALLFIGSRVLVVFEVLAEFGRVVPRVPSRRHEKAGASGGNSGFWGRGFSRVLRARTPTRLAEDQGRLGEPSLHLIGRDVSPSFLPPYQPSTWA